MNFANLKVGQKVGVSFGIAIILMLIMIVVNYFGVQNAKSQAVLAVLAVKVQVRILDFRRIEKDFLNAQTMEPAERLKLLEDHAAIVKDLKDLLASINQKSSDKKIDEAADSVLAAAKTYEDKFKEAVDAVKTIGLNGEEGLRNEMNINAASIVRELEKLGLVEVERQA